MTPQESRMPGSAGRRVVRGTLWLSFGQGITLITMTLWTIIVARYVGPGTYGLYTYAQSMIAVLLVLPGLSLDSLLVRDVAQQPYLGWAYLSRALFIRLILCGSVLGGYLAIDIMRGGSGEWLALLTIVVLNGFITALGALAAAMLMAQEAMGRVVMAQSANGILTLVTGAVAAGLHQPFIVIMGLSLIATCVQVVMTYRFVVRVYGKTQVRHLSTLISRSALIGLLVKALPFAALGLLAALQGNLMVLIMRSTGQDVAMIGYYAVASRIYVMTLIVPEKLSQALVPAFSRIYVEAPDQFGTAFERAYRYVLFITVPMAVGLWVIAPGVLLLLFGAKYQPATNALRVLALGLLSGVGYVMGPALTAMNKQTLLAWTWGITAVVMTITGYWAIPRYGAEGAACAILLGNLIGLILYSTLLFRWLSLHYPLVWVGKIVLAALGMGLVASWLAHRLHLLIVAILISPAAYMLFLFLLRTMTLNDQRQLFSPFVLPVTDRLGRYSRTVSRWAARFKNPQ